MAKKSIKYSFKNGVISKDSETGKYVLTEINKDDSEDFDLTALIDEIVGIEGISMSFGSEDVVPTIVE